MLVCLWCQLMCFTRLLHNSDVSWASRGVSGYRQLHRFFHSLSKLTWNETSKHRIVGPLWGESIGDCCFPTLRAISWHHHDKHRSHPHSGHRLHYSVKKRRNNSVVIMPKQRHDVIMTLLHHVSAGYHRSHCHIAIIINAFIVHITKSVSYKY